MTELWGEGKCGWTTQVDQVGALSNWLVSWGDGLNVPREYILLGSVAPSPVRWPRHLCYPHLRNGHDGAPIKTKRCSLSS